MIRVIYILILIQFNEPFALANDCPKDFAGTGRYVFSNDDLSRIQSFCRNGQPQELRPAGTAVPPEMYLYAAYICEQQGRNFVFPAFRSSAHALAVEGPRGPSSTYWRPLTHAKPDFAGVPARLKEQWKKTALSKLKNEMDQPAGSSYDVRAEFMLRIKLAMPFLEEDELKAAVRELASRRALGLAATYNGLPSPKLFQFTKEAIRRDLGLPYRSLTDLVFARPDGNTTWVMLLSVDHPAQAPSNTVWSNGVGITSVRNTFKNLDSFQEGQILDEGVANWKIGERKYEASYKLTVGKRTEGFAPQMNSLDHEALRADGKLTGMIFPGVNMGEGEAGAREVMNEYQKYYQNRGFKFGKLTPVNDFGELMATEIKSGRLDYLVKEEHALGGSSFAQIAKRGSLKTGRKGDEVIHIFYPEKKALEQEQGEAVHFEQAADWMKARTAAGGKQLLYVDTSCSGIGPACRLAMMAGDKNLVVSGGADSMDTFTNSPSSPIYHLLEGVRGKKDFPSIEAAMRDANSENEATYLLPHSAEWKKQVLEANPVALNGQIRVLEDGKPVDLETVGR